MVKILVKKLKAVFSTSIFDNCCNSDKPIGESPSEEISIKGFLYVYFLTLKQF